MSDNWEVKKITKSGSDFNITVGPVDSGQGVLMVVMALIMAFGTMHLFDLTGVAWAFFLWLVFAGVSAILFVPSLIVSALILIAFFAT